jgi:mannosyltransferase
MAATGRDGAGHRAQALLERWPGVGPGHDERWPTVVVVAATAMACALGLYQLGDPAFDYDEAYSLGVVRGSFADTWVRITNWDIVQAPYYLLLHLWYRVGESELVLRLPSVVGYVASVPLVFVVGRRALDARVGAIAAVLLALNGLALSWAQQARSYAMVLALVPLTTWVLLWALDRPRSAVRGVVYGALAAVAVYAHFLVGLVVAAQLVAMLLRRPRPWRVAAAAAGTLAVLTAPAVIWVATLSSDPLNWIEPPSLRHLLSMLADLSGGGPPQFFVIGPLVVVAAAAARSWHRRAPGSPRAWGHLLLLVCLVLPVALLVASTYTVKPLLHARYLIPVVPYFALVAASGLVWLVERRRSLGLAVGAVVLGAALAGATTHYLTNTEHEWRTATTMVLDGSRPGEPVAVVPGQARQVVEYQLRRLDAADRVVPVSPRRGDPPVGPRIWVVHEERNAPMPYDPMPGFDDWLADHYRLVHEEPASDRITVRRYELVG